LEVIRQDKHIVGVAFHIQHLLDGVEVERTVQVRELFPRGYAGRRLVG
jgi:hypothetical protein